MSVAEFAEYCNISEQKMRSLKLISHPPFGILVHLITAYQEIF